MRVCLIFLMILPFISGKVLSSNGGKKFNSGEITTLAIPGLIFGLEEIVKNQRIQEKKIKELVGKNSITYLGVQNAYRIDVNPHFLTSIEIFSDEKYLSLATHNKCNFYGLLENNLLRGVEGDISEFLVDIVFDAEGKKKMTAFMKVDDFLKYKYNKECLSNKDLPTLFKVKNLKQTVNSIEMKVPKDQQSCREIISSWKKNIYTPFLCKISNILGIRGESAQTKRKLKSMLFFSKKIKKYFSNFQINYMNNMCQSLNFDKNFCERYLARSYWAKVINGERYDGPLYYGCTGVLGKKKIDEADFSDCAKKMDEDDRVCNYNNYLLFPSLTPRPNCSSISFALNHSRLYDHYQDCPGRTDNVAIVNAYRIMAHFSKLTTPSTIINCSSQALSSFLNLIFENGSNEIWNFNLCYYNKVLLKNYCYPFYYGNQKNDPRSEVNVVARILKEGFGGESKLRCSLVRKRDFISYLLKYKQGCYLIYNFNSCTGMNCKKKVVFNGETIKGITYKTGTLFNYFPIQSKDDFYSISFALDYKYNFKKREIRDTTQLIFHLNNFRDLIIHGVGCREDILPSFFKSLSINQCTPLPFIVDGYFEKDYRRFLIVRSGIDDINSPRIIPWNFIYSAVFNYSSLHPQGLWTLYAIR